MKQPMIGSHGAPLRRVPSYTPPVQSAPHSSSTLPQPARPSLSYTPGVGISRSSGATAMLQPGLLTSMATQMNRQPTTMLDVGSMAQGASHLQLDTSLQDAGVAGDSLLRSHPNSSVHRQMNFQQSSNQIPPVQQLSWTPLPVQQTGQGPSRSQQSQWLQQVAQPAEHLQQFAQQMALNQQQLLQAQPLLQQPQLQAPSLPQASLHMQNSLLRPVRGDSGQMPPGNGLSLSMGKQPCFNFNFQAAPAQQSHQMASGW